MHLEDALRKIKKCLALAKDKSADPNIAASAMRQAQALMAEFNVSNDDARLSEVTTEECSARTNKHPRWEAWLAAEIAEAFGCDRIWTRDSKWLHGRAVHRSAIVFVGIGAAPKIAGYAWDVLSRQCAKARLAHIRSQPGRCKPITLTARGDVFAEGWVASATAKLQKLAGTQAERLLIENYMKAAYPGSTTFKPVVRATGRNVSHNDFRQGYVIGQGAQLDHGVGTSVQGLLQ
jgi:hypothetical protein